MSHDSFVPDVVNAADSGPTTDWPYRILVTALLLVGVWLLAMPWIPAIARCTMQRFHLRTNSFIAWAIQQPIPPMYSFANTTEVRSGPPATLTHSLPTAYSVELAGTGESEPSSPNDRVFTEVIAARTINHFPTREFTFANARVRFLRERRSRWFVLQSRYRGQNIRSVYRLDPMNDKGWRATLMEDQTTAARNGS